MNFELGQVIFILLSILFHPTNFSTLSKQENDLFENKFPLKLDRYSFIMSPHPPPQKKKNGNTR